MISGLTDDAVVEKAGAAERLTVRKAGMPDLAPILQLINGYAAKGIMLPRTEFELSESIRDFSVALAAEQVVGCGALHFYSPVMGEVRSLAVDEAWKTHGAGRRLVEALVEEATRYSLDALFAFTYVPGFFRKLGFQEVERGVLPLKAWKDCLRCPKFRCCDEIAVLKVLRPERWHGAQPPSWSELTENEGLIQFPTVRSSSPEY